MQLFDGKVFDQQLYREMLEYQNWLRLWLIKYGTTDLFDEWFELKMEVERCSGLSMAS